MEQLLLVASCDSPAGIGASLRTDTRTHKGQHTDGWTGRRDIGNSILDNVCEYKKLEKTSIKKLCPLNIDKDLVLKSCLN